MLEDISSELSWRGDRLCHVYFQPRCVEGNGNVLGCVNGPTITPGDWDNDEADDDDIFLGESKICVWNKI